MLEHTAQGEAATVSTAVIERPFTRTAGEPIAGDRGGTNALADLGGLGAGEGHLSGANVFRAAGSFQR